MLAELPMPALGTHRLRVAFPDGDVCLDAIWLASNRPTGYAPLTVRFSDQTRDYPMDYWQWDFGDRNSSHEQRPVHVYTAPGTYTVRFYARADGGWVLAGQSSLMWLAVWNQQYPIEHRDLVAVHPPPAALPGTGQTPRDLDGDGLYEDVNGNGQADFADIVPYFNQMAWIAENGPVVAFDFNGNGRIDFADVVALFNGL